jgi:hypothetical protein
VPGVGPAPGHEAEYYGAQLSRTYNTYNATMDKVFYGGDGLTVANRALLFAEAPVQGAIGMGVATFDVADEVARSAASAVSSGTARAWHALTPW